MEDVKVISAATYLDLAVEPLKEKNTDKREWREESDSNAVAMALGEVEFVATELIFVNFFWLYFS